KKPSSTREESDPSEAPAGASGAALDKKTAMPAPSANAKPAVPNKKSSSTREESDPSEAPAGASGATRDKKTAMPAPSANAKPAVPNKKSSSTREESDPSEAPAGASGAALDNKTETIVLSSVPPESPSSPSQVADAMEIDSLTPLQADKDAAVSEDQAIEDDAAAGQHNVARLGDMDGFEGPLAGNYRSEPPPANPAQAMKRGGHQSVDVKDVEVVGDDNGVGRSSEKRKCPEDEAALVGSRKRRAVELSGNASCDNARLLLHFLELNAQRDEVEERCRDLMKRVTELHDLACSEERRLLSHM
ncbi:hypothetical protein AURDEDRAFT_131342, partial [Auricularia subglabra TFB-10046 SS5]